jgi:hypothetical protein
MKALWKWNSNEIVSQYTKMVFVAHLKYKMRFIFQIQNTTKLYGRYYTSTIYNLQKAKDRDQTE